MLKEKLGLGSNYGLRAQKDDGLDMLWKGLRCRIYLKR